MKLQVPFLQLPICFDAEVLASEIESIESSAWMPHPQGFPGNDALTLITAGGDPKSDALSGPMRPTPHLLRCPYLMQSLEAIGATWGRTRLMRLSGKAEVSPHIDTNYYWRERVRVHVPIITQPTVRFQCGNSQINMKRGECWIFDTWRMHNVVNDHASARVHLVADTVGGEAFWGHLASARPHDVEIPNWPLRKFEPDGTRIPDLDYESRNVPLVMSPWELREHVIFFLGEAREQVQLQGVHRLLLRFTRKWTALWACFGEEERGWPRYQALIDEVIQELIEANAGSLQLRNGIGFLFALHDAVLSVAVSKYKLNNPHLASLIQP